MKKVQKTSKRIFAMILMVSLMVVSLCAQAFALEETGSEIEIPVTQNFKVEGTSSSGVDTKTAYQLIALDKKAPMPSGSTDGVYSFELKGDQTAELPAITFTEHETYQYNLKIVSESKSGYTYDNSVFLITVYAVDRADEGIVTFMTIEKEGIEGKFEKIEFKNKFVYSENPEKPTIKPTQKPTVRPTSSVTETTGSGNKGNVSTGDAGSIMLIVLISSVIVASFILIAFVKKKKAEEK